MAATKQRFETKTSTGNKISKPKATARSLTKPHLAPRAPERPTVESIADSADVNAIVFISAFHGFPKPPETPAPATHPESPDPPPPHSQGCPTHAQREPRSNPCPGLRRHWDTLFLPPPQHRAGLVAATPEAVSPRPARPCPRPRGEAVRRFKDGRGTRRSVTLGRRL